MEDVTQVSQWVQVVVAALGALVTYFLVPFLRQKAGAAKAERDKLEAQTVGTNITSRGILVKRLQEFLYGSAAAIAEKRFPLLAEMVLTKSLSKDEIKKELRMWGGTLKQEAQVYFDNQGIDLVKAVGDDALDNLIERAANKVSPFPGRDTAKELLKSKVSNFIINKGVEWVKSRYLKVDEMSDLKE